MHITMGKVCGWTLSPPNQIDLWTRLSYWLLALVNGDISKDHKEYHKDYKEYSKAEEYWKDR